MYWRACTNQNRWHIKDRKCHPKVRGKFHFYCRCCHGVTVKCMQWLLWILNETDFPCKVKGNVAGIWDILKGRKRGKETKHAYQGSLKLNVRVVDLALYVRIHRVNYFLVFFPSKYPKFQRRFPWLCIESLFHLKSKRITACTSLWLRDSTCNKLGISLLLLHETFDPLCATDFDSCIFSNTFFAFWHFIYFWSKFPGKFVWDSHRWFRSVHCLGSMFFIFIEVSGWVRMAGASHMRQKKHSEAWPSPFSILRGHETNRRMESK